MHNVHPRSLCSWPRPSLHLLEDGHNHPIVRFAYLCHMIGEELVFFSFLYIKLFELGVEVAFNHRSVVTHHKECLHCYAWMPSYKDIKHQYRYTACSFSKKIFKFSVNGFNMTIFVSGTHQGERRLCRRIQRSFQPTHQKEQMVDLRQSLVMFISFPSFMEIRVEGGLPKIGTIIAKVFWFNYTRVATECDTISEIVSLNFNQVLWSFIFLSAEIVGSSCVSRLSGVRASSLKIIRNVTRISSLKI